MNQVYIQLGSNLGDRMHFLEIARNLISQELGVITKKSKIYESSSWGVDDQAFFLNQVILLATSQDPLKLLRSILNIENKIGRVRLEKWGERIIDIDILFYNDEIIESIDLCIPHKYLSKRKFVLIPLCEIAQDFNHPKYNKNISMLLEECLDVEKVNIYEE
ncbi:MAG: 2-amino-4-hydroxy-6-hydroxymethyldihydropteridine diphosphokinase [Flavobacteriales bacterium]|jgi:2-amino-4-hydroxy-6-hydroxymethyldihydropteridine diphosphokinase|nr:2-amino-4-hydroxy-6-hydroxymethyldihydropteridine diphosphokinase [Flavobacteriales bacterium]|tara:strand:+ start:17729 stop:18214 length:486 start_codon:yes stop_codon:yes gene_type:complete